MLVLTREHGEGVQFDTKDGRVLIWVERSGRARVKLYLDAPRSVLISRIDEDGNTIGAKRCQSTTTTT